MTDAAQKEFSREILALQAAMGFTDAEFSGMLMGAAVVLAMEAGFSRGQVLAVAGSCYDNILKSGAANDA